jgi:hypothetical protein
MVTRKRPPASRAQPNFFIQRYIGRRSVFDLGQGIADGPLRFFAGRVLPAPVTALRLHGRVLANAPHQLGKE